MKKLPPWKRVEADFRLWSFYVYHKTSYATERDPTLRFGKALCASLEPIRDRQKVWKWWDKYSRDNSARRRKAADTLEQETDEQEGMSNGTVQDRPAEIDPG